MHSPQLSMKGFSSDFLLHFFRADRKSFSLFFPLFAPCAVNYDANENILLGIMSRCYESWSHEIFRIGSPSCCVISLAYFEACRKNPEVKPKKLSLVLARPEIPALILYHEPILSRFFVVVVNWINPHSKRCDNKMESAKWLQRVLLLSYRSWANNKWISKRLISGDIQIH